MPLIARHGLQRLHTHPRDRQIGRVGTKELGPQHKARRLRRTRLGSPTGAGTGPGRPSSRAARVRPTVAHRLGALTLGRGQTGPSTVGTEARKAQRTRPA